MIAGASLKAWRLPPKLSWKDTAGWPSRSSAPRPVSAEENSKTAACHVTHICIIFTLPDSDADAS